MPDSDALAETVPDSVPLELRLSDEDDEREGDPVEDAELQPEEVKVVVTVVDTLADEHGLADKVPLPDTLDV